MWQAFIFFLCPTPELAEASVWMDRVHHECRWLDEKVGTIDYIHHDFEMDGEVIQIGYVRMASGQSGYSAGVAPNMY